MTSRLTPLLAACAALLLLAAVGCGGSSGGDESTSGSTESTTTSGPAGGQARLTEAQWSDYQEKKTSAQQANQQAVKTFTTCRALIDQGKSASVVQDCFEGSTESVVAEGQQLLPFIADLGRTLRAGTCATATGNLYDGIKLYISSVNALNLSAQGGTVPPIQSVDTAKRALVAAQASTKAFETACKPA